MPLSPPRVLTPKANAGEEQPCFSVGSWKLQIQYRGIKNSLDFSPPTIILCYPRVLDQLLQNPAGLIFIRLLLPPPESPKRLFILGAGGERELFLLPHLLSSDIKASRFAPPSLILPFSLPPMFCKFPCILLRVIQCPWYLSAG